MITALPFKFNNIYKMINIILDIGTLNTKAGFAAEASPRIKTESFYISAESQKIENDD